MNQFNYEFDYLENVIRPSLIKILINSEGGSVLYGMSTYSTIRNSKIPTESVVEGIAASMGSIIWAAADRSLMRDYAFILIHSPFKPGEREKEPSELVKAFSKQIETIYRKRFGLKTEQVRMIMNGEAGKDGTFFDSAGAVKAGIIPAENILHTSKQICERVKNELAGIEDVSQMQTLMSEISASLPLETDDKLFVVQSSNLTQEVNYHNMNTENNKFSEYAAVAASLGLKDDSEVKDVMARINMLVSVEGRLKETEKSLADAQTVIAGKEASITNLQKDLATANASLTAYQQKEAAEKKTKNETMVEAAIDAGKITRDSKEGWMAMADNNPELVERTFASIPEREQISKEIAKDPANIEAATKAAKTAEELIGEKVTQVVGENFEFKKIK